MGQRKGRLSPDEVKRAMADEQRERAEAEPFHSPFAAARERLEKIVPAKPPASVRLRQRAAQKPGEPSELARVRAAHKAARQALAKAVAPVVRPGRRGGRGPGSDGDGEPGGGGADGAR